MPLEITDYDLNKISFIAANNKDNLYIVYYNFVHAHLLSGPIDINNHNITVKVNRKYGSTKIYFRPVEKSHDEKLETCASIDLKKQETVDANRNNSHEYSDNYNKFITFVNRIRSLLCEDFMKKNIAGKSPDLITPYDVVLTVKTNKFNNISGGISNGGTKYSISTNELMYILKSKIVCKLEVSPEYFYIGKRKKDGHDNFRLGIVLKSLHIENDQLHKLPKRIEVMIKYGTNKDKINDIKQLDQLYDNKIKPMYVSKKTIMDNILNLTAPSK